MIAKYYDDKELQSNAIVRVFEMNGRLVSEFYVNDIEQYYPPNNYPGIDVPRFKLLEPKLELVSLMPYIHGYGKIQNCHSGMGLEGPVAVIRETGAVWMMPSGQLLVFGEAEVKQFKSKGGNFDLNDIETRPKRSSTNSELVWAMEPTPQQILLTSNFKEVDGSISSFSELYEVTDEQLVLISSWELLAHSVSICVDSVIMNLSNDGSQMIHRDLHTGQLVQRLQLPKSIDKEVTEYEFVEKLNVLRAENWSRRSIRTYDLFDLSVVPNVVSDLDSKELNFVYWDRKNQIAWFAFRTQIIGVNKDSRVLRTTDCGYDVVSVQYSKSTNSIIAMGDRPPQWTVIGL